MNATALLTAIKDRSKGDDGAGGLMQTGSPMVSGVYNTIAPTSLSDTDSYVVLSVASAAQRDGFAIDVVEYTFYVSIFTPVSSGMTHPQAAIDRVYGNGVTQAGRVPTYGLHRWQPTLSGSNWVCSLMERIDQNSNHSENVYNHVETYRVFASLKA